MNCSASAGLSCAVLAIYILSAACTQGVDARDSGGEIGKDRQTTVASGTGVCSPLRQSTVASWAYGAPQKHACNIVQTTPTLETDLDPLKKACGPQMSPAVRDKSDRVHASHPDALDALSPFGRAKPPCNLRWPGRSILWKTDHLCCSALEKWSDLASGSIQTCDRTRPLGCC